MTTLVGGKFSSRGIIPVPLSRTGSVVGWVVGLQISLKSKLPRKELIRNKLVDTFTDLTKSSHFWVTACKSKRTNIDIHCFRLPVIFKSGSHENCIKQINKIHILLVPLTSWLWFVVFSTQQALLMSKIEADKQEERRKMCGTMQDVVIAVLLPVFFFV